MGLRWEPDMKGGRYPFLCTADVLEVKKEAYERCQSDTNYIELSDFLEIVMDVKATRVLLAAKFLHSINCHALAENLDQDDELEPTRPYINKIIEVLDLVLETPTGISRESYNDSSKI